MGLKVTRGQFSVEMKPGQTPEDMVEELDRMELRHNLGYDAGFYVWVGITSVMFLWASFVLGGIYSTIPTFISIVAISIVAISIALVQYSRINSTPEQLTTPFTEAVAIRLWHEAHYYSRDARTEAAAKVRKQYGDAAELFFWRASLKPNELFRDFYARHLRENTPVNGNNPP